MGHLSSPLVLALGSTPGEASGPGIPQVNTELFGANVATQWTFVGAGALVQSIPWENGFFPATATAALAGDYAFGSTCALYTTTSIPAQPTDRINCISCYVKVPGAGVVSPQCRLEFRITAGAILSIDVDPRSGILIAKTPGVLNPQVQRIVLPLFANVENVSVYRISFAFDSGGTATGIPRFYPRTDGSAAGTTVFGGTQLEWMVSVPSPFITPNAAAPGIRRFGQTARQTTTPNLSEKTLGAGLSPYAVDPSADQDTWLNCDIAAGNIVNLPQALAVTFDMPVGSRLLITQSPTAIGGITTINAAANSIIAPGGITGTFTTVTFPSADFPNVTQMMLIKTAVLNQWQIIATSAGGSAGGLFLQIGTGAIPRTFQNRGLDTVSLFDFMTIAQINDVQSGTLLIDVTAAVQAALNVGGDIYAPLGDYKITAPLIPPNTVKSIRIHGTGMNDQPFATNRPATRFVGFGNGFGASGILNLGNAGVTLTDTHLENICIAADPACTVTRGIIANSLQYSWSFRNVYSRAINGSGGSNAAAIEFINCWAGKVDHCRASNIAGIGYLIRGAISTQFDSCSAALCELSGAYLTDDNDAPGFSPCYGTSIRGGEWIQNNTTANAAHGGVVVFSAFGGCNTVDAYFEDNQIGNVRYLGGGNAVQIEGGQIAGNSFALPSYSGDHITIDNAKGLNVSGNRFATATAGKTINHVNLLANATRNTIGRNYWGNTAGTNVLINDNSTASDNVCDTGDGEFSTAFELAGVTGTSAAANMTRCGSAFASEYFADRDGWISGISAQSNSNAGTGTWSVQVAINGALVGTAVTVAPPVLTGHAIQKINALPFVAGDRIQLRVSSNLLTNVHAILGDVEFQYGNLP